MSAKDPTAKEASARLTVREIEFCKLYATDSEIHGNAVQCFFKAGLAAPAEQGTTPYHVAGDAAAVLLRTPKVSSYVGKLIKEAHDVAKITVSRLAQSLGRDAFADRSAMFDDAGDQLPPNKWPKELRSIISSIDPVELKSGARAYKVKFNSATEAKKILAQWLKMIDKADKPSEDASGGSTARLESVLAALQASGFPTGETGGRVEGCDAGGIPVRAECGTSTGDDLQSSG